MAPLPVRLPGVVHAPRAAAVTALSLIAVAVGVVAYLHLVTGISPVRGMVSDYVFSPAGVVLLPVAVLVFAAALAMLGRGLASVGIECRPLAVLLTVAMVGSVLIAACRADATGAVSTPVGVLHKIGGVLLFGALPVCGWLMARRFASDPRWRWLSLPLRCLSVAAAAVFAVLLLSYLPLYGVAMPGGGVLAGSQGLLERCVLVLELAMVVLVAVRLMTVPVSPAVAS